MTKSSRRDVILMGLITFSNLGYLLFPSEVISATPEVSRLMTLLLLQNLIWLWLWFTVKNPPRFLCLALAGLAVFFTLLKPPILENDFYRYFWDGHQILQNSHPYAVAPAKGKLEGLKSVQSKIGFPEIRTIYPPLTELVFAGIAKVSGKKLTPFLWGLALGGYFLFAIALFKLQRRNDLPDVSPRLSLLLLHPLLLHEWVQTVHYDSWSSSALLLSFACEGIIWQAMWQGIAAGMRFPLGIALALGRDRFPKAKLGIALLVFAIPFLIFRDDLAGMFDSLRTFSTQWEMNSGVFRLIRETAYWICPHPEQASLIARAVSTGIWVLISGVIFFTKYRDPREKLFWILYFLVLLSPVVNPWYFTWSLPLVIFLPPSRLKYAIAAFAALPLAYSIDLPKVLPFPFQRLWDIEHLWLWSMAGLAWRNEPARK